MIYKMSDFINDITLIFNNKKISEVDTPIKVDIPVELTALNNEIQQVTEIEDVFEIKKPQKFKKYKPKIWDSSKSPLSSYQKKYLKKKSTELKIKMENAEKLTFDNIKPSILASALTRLDINYLKGIHVSELYDFGKKDCLGINAWLKFNNTVQNMVIKNMNPAYFIAVAEELENYQNYNTLNSVITALKNAKLDQKMYKKMAKLVQCDNYFIMREKIDKLENDFAIVPVNLFLKDIEECNKNLESEIASKRFIKQLDFFVSMQGNKFKSKHRLKRKIEHFLYINLHSCIDFVVERKEDEMVETASGSYFLFI